MTVKSDKVRWALALVPYNGSTFEASWRRAIFVDDGGTSSRESFDETFYESLLAVPWLSPQVRHAVMKELGRSVREHNRGSENARTAALRWSIGERKKQLLKEGKHQRGGAHDAAVEEIAGMQGMTAAALRKRLTRYKQPQE
jgi:hypothetical protein